MMFVQAVATLFLVATVAEARFWSRNQPSSKPNFVYIIADDQ